MARRGLAALVVGLLAISAVALPATVLPAAALPATVPAADAATAASPAAGTEYVALGDSYASGFGLGQATGEPVAGCGQSSLDYPHLVAKELALRLVDVTCAGATTADVVDTRQLGAAPQVDALGSRTRLVTLTIGGNDADLVGTVASCIAVAADGPVVATGDPTCKASLDRGGVDSLTTAVDDTVIPGVKRALAAIAAKAPSARIVVVGYPAMFPDAAHTPAAGCFRALVHGSGADVRFSADAFPFTPTDVVYLARMQTRLDAALRSATVGAGAEYVSTLDASLGHSACASTGSYIRGVTLTADSTFSNISLVDGSLHPNEAGSAFLASQLTAALRTAPGPGSASGAADASDAGGIDLIWLVLAGLVVVFAVIVLLAARGIRRARREAERGRR